MKTVETLSVEMIYKQYASLMYSRCMKYLGSSDEAQDAVQEIFMKLLDKLPDIQSPAALYRWLMTTTTNHCISAIRKRNVRRSEAFEDQFEHAEDAEWLLTNRMYFRQLFAPFDKRVVQAVLLNVVEGYTSFEVAEMLCIGESTVRKYIHDFKQHSKRKQERAA